MAKLKSVIKEWRNLSTKNPLYPTSIKEFEREEKKNLKK